MNAKCFDCEAWEPSWCSLNLGIWLCSSCSGHHRSFGTHISRVKSWTLDNWTEKEMKYLRFGGNEILESILERYPFPTNYTVHELYHSNIVEWYRNYLTQVVNTSMESASNLLEAYENDRKKCHTWTTSFAHSESDIWLDEVVPGKCSGIEKMHTCPVGGRQAFDGFPEPPSENRGTMLIQGYSRAWCRRYSRFELRWRREAAEKRMLEEWQNWHHG